MAQAREVGDGLGDALVVGGPDDVDGRGRDGAADRHHRKLPVQLGEVLGGSLRADEDQGLAAGVQQRLHRPALVAAPGDGAQDEVVAATVGGLLDVLHELGVERVGDVHDHADEPAAPAGQQARRPVRPVAQLRRRLQHALPGGGARPRDAPEHERHRRGGHPGGRGDVAEPRAAGRFSCGQRITLHVLTGTRALSHTIEAL